MSMPRQVQEGIEHLSIQQSAPKGRELRQLRQERWVYGFHLKNRLVNRFVEQYNLPMKKNPMYTLSQIIGHIRAVSGVFFRMASTSIRGRPAIILFFVEDDGRKRLRDLECSKEDMEKVREVMGFTNERKPGWYAICGRYDDDHEFSSEDEQWGGEDRPVRRTDVEQVEYECIDLDEEDWDSDEEDESDVNDSVEIAK